MVLAPTALILGPKTKPEANGTSEEEEEPQFEGDAL